MKKYEGILLCTDVDHTLINNDGVLPDENAKAINYFMENGGMFTMCSGRPPLYLTKFHDKVIPNVPVISHGGATLYDYKQEKYIRTVWLCEKLALEALMTVINSYKSDIYYLCLYSLDFQYMYCPAKIADISVDDFINKFPCIKKNKFVMSFTEEAVAHSVRESFCANTKYNDVFEFARSWSFGVEVLPIDGNKASGVLNLKKYLGNVDKVVCVGDFENDISMLKVADISYAVENACSSAKAAASRITVSNEESALAKIIAEL